MKDSNLKVGDTFNFWQNPKGSYKAHVVSVIVEGDYTMIVYRWYGTYKQWWHYEVKDTKSVQMIIDLNNEMIEERRN